MNIIGSNVVFGSGDAEFVKKFGLFEAAQYISSGAPFPLRLYRTNYRSTYFLRQFNNYSTVNTP